MQSTRQIDATDKKYTKKEIMEDSREVNLKWILLDCAFSFTFPELLMHLWMQKKTATHAINKVVASGTRISPASQHIMKWKKFVCIMAIHANKQNHLSGQDKKISLLLDKSFPSFPLAKS